MKEHVIHFFLVAFITICCAGTLSAQTTVKGKVVDAENDEPLIGAAVMQRGTTQGVVTDVDGNFEIKVSPGSTLIFRSLGYKEVTRTVSGSANVDLGTIAMAIDAVGLADVTITSSIAVDRQTPIAMSTIEPLQIEERLGVQDFPELLKATPSIYVSKEGGGYGDSKVVLRGFKAENVAIMVNGVPMNDMEWGGVYWSNWAGLSDVTRSMQIQRGIGASQVSSPSVGGSINIVTKTIDAKKGGFASYGIGENGYNKLMFSVSTGLSKDGWAFTILGSKSWGDGYVQGNDFDAYSYFINIAKRLGDKHQLSLTAFGAPQTHYQRSAYDGLTIEGWQGVKQYMKPGDEYRYNPTYGYGKNGERKTSAKNMYHKPQISLNHMWDINNTSSLSTAFYVSIGEGWGYRGEGTNDYRNSWYGSSNGTLNTQFRNADGTFAYDQIQELNENSRNGSQMVMALNKNNHQWYGLISTYKKDLNENFKILGGIDGRYYKGIHVAEIEDLYNGEYYIDRHRGPKSVLSGNHSLAGTDAFVNKKLTVGDIIYRDYDSHIWQGGVFGQGEYTLGGLNALIAGSVNYTNQWRYDRFYYNGKNSKSDSVDKIGFNLKGGANYNITDNHNVFANVGYISRAPFFSGGIFLNSTTSNVVNPDAVNEKIFSVEAGYGFRSSFLAANLNIYHTKWMDKTMARTVESGSERGTVNMQGVDATHQGIELDLEAKPFTWLDVTGMFSINNWRWTNDASGYFYNSSGQPINADFEVVPNIGSGDHARMDIEFDNAKVGGAAQTTAKLGVVFKPKDFRIGLDWYYYGRNYADWSFNTNDIVMNGTKTFEKPWQIPSFNLFELFASYSFKIGSLPATVSGNITNIFDQEHIQSAVDGADHDWKTAYRVFYGFGRQMNMRIKVNF